MDSAALVEKIRTEYDRLDKICGVSTKGAAIRISSRMTSTLGMFKPGNWLRRIPMEIIISQRICENEEIFMDVIRHEYAHMLVFLRQPHRRHGHDSVWKKACLEVGCQPSATYKDLSGDLFPSRTVSYKYEVVCRGCGAVSRYKKESRVVKIVKHKMRGKVICKVCGGNSFYIAEVKNQKEIEEQIYLDELLK